MADSLGMQDLRGLQVDKLLKGFADEPFVFKNDLLVSPTSAREIKWFQKTAGTLTGPTTTSETVDIMRTQEFGTLPPVIEQTAIKRTSYARPFTAETPWFTYADIKDCDPDMLAANIRDVTRGIQNQVDYVILNTVSGSTPLSGSCLGTGWSDTTNGQPFMDLLSGAMAIRGYGYDVTDLKIWVHPLDYKNLMNWFVVKGSQVPQLATSLAQNGVLTKIANVSVAVSNNCTQGQSWMHIPQRTATWKEFTPLKSFTKEEPGIGTKIRVIEAGVCLLTDPYSACLLLQY